MISLLPVPAARRPAVHEVVPLPKSPVAAEPAMHTSKWQRLERAAGWFGLGIALLATLVVFAVPAARTSWFERPPRGAPRRR